MRVLVAHNSYTQVGGEDEVFRNETFLLRQAGFEVYEYLEDNERIAEMGLASVGLNTIWSESSRLRLRRSLQGFRPDIVHFHNTFPLISPSAYAACADEGVPVVQTLHNYRLLCPAATLFRDGKVCQDCLLQTIKWPAVMHRCYRGSYLGTSTVVTMLAVHSWLKTWQKQVARFIALTEFSRLKFIEGGLPGPKISVKPNFVTPDPGVAMSRGKFALYVGRLVPEKGLQLLLDAWENLSESIPLRIIGDGPLRARLATDIRARGLGNVDLVGRLPKNEVIAAMQQARFLVFPSGWFEGFPMTLVEAFACGLAVIASRLGSVAEIVKDGVTGLQFAPGGAAELAEKVTWAWSHPDEVDRMGTAGRLEYQEKYTPQRNLEMLLDIYWETLNKPTKLMAKVATADASKG
jgi:glycosyltransferase involved in cell wall biosynthesis